MRELLFSEWILILIPFIATVITVISTARMLYREVSLRKREERRQAQQNDFQPPGGINHSTIKKEAF